MKTASVLTALLARLATIRVTNGYHSDAGLRVYRTLLGMPLPEALTLPALFVRLDGVSMDAMNQTRSSDVRETFRVVIEGAVPVINTTAPDEALLNLLFDVRTALLAETAFSGLLHGIDPIAMEAASFRLPEGGAALAVVVQPVTFRYAERYTLA